MQDVWKYLAMLSVKWFLFRQACKKVIWYLKPSSYGYLFVYLQHHSLALLLLFTQRVSCRFCNAKNLTFFVKTIDASVCGMLHFKSE